jgi:hypothetical protein
MPSHILRALAFGVLELGSVAAFVGALLVWAVALSGA